MKDKFVTPGESTEEREEFWLRLIAEARQYSGGIAKFCRDRKIGKEVYYQWFGKLKGKIDSWQKPLDTNSKRRKHPVKEKNKTNAVPVRSRREWRALVDRWRESGLKACEFARNNNLHPVTFCRWIRKFAGKHSEKPRKAKQQAPSEDFVRVNVVDDSEETESITSPADMPAPENMIEIVLTNNRIIRVASGFTPDLLKAVVLTLEEC